MLAAAEVFASAAAAFDALVHRLPAAGSDRTGGQLGGDGGTGWDGPGLGAWDLRSLIGHASRSLVTVDAYLDRPAASAVVDSPAAYFALGRAIASGQGAAGVVDRGVAAGKALGPDPSAAVHRLVVEVVGRVSGSEDVLIETIAGGMWLRDYLPTRTFELAVHSLDIAAATGVDPDLPRGVLDQALALAAGVAAILGDGPDVLLALTGRVRLPTGYSIV